MKKIKFKFITLNLVLAFIFSLFFSPFSMAFLKAEKRPVNAKIDESAGFKIDEVIVKFKPSIGKKDKEILQKQVGIQTVKKFSITGSELVKIKNGAKVKDVIERLKKNPNVIYAQPNYIHYADSSVNDPYFNNLWGLHNTGQYIGNTEGNPDVDIDASEAWVLSQGSDQIIVGVIDTGTDINHPDLQDNIWSNPGEVPGDGLDNDSNGYIDDVNGWDFWNNDNTVYDPKDGDEHGTHVSGTIAGISNNNTGVIGVAPKVKIMPLKFIGPDYGYTSGAIEALNYAKKMGVRITNNSWGGGPYEPALYDCINSFDGVFVAAAGNRQINNDINPHYPSSYDSDNILSVAAVNNQGELAVFSNYGPTSVDVGGPGQDILSTTPDNTYSYYSGTSMATPHVSGIVALMLSTGPGLTPLQVCDIIKQTVDPLASLQGKTVTGGMANAFKALATVKGIPFIKSTDPTNLAREVPVDKNIIINFNEDILPGSTLNNISLKTGETVISYTYSINGKTLTLNPVTNLEINKTYSVNIPSGAVTDLDGNVFPLDYSFNFNSPDTLPPIVTASEPFDGAINVLVDSNINITFNEKIAEGFNLSGIVLSDGINTVPCSYFIKGNKLIIDPFSNLSYLTTYSLQIPAGAVYDLSGNSVNEFSMSFKTQYQPPVVSITSPADGSTLGPAGEMVTINADAAAQAGITKVEFYIDNSYVGEKTTLPYSVNWTSTAGNHNIYAIAYDTKGQSTKSSIVNVSVPTKGTLTRPINGSLVGGVVTQFTATFDYPLYGETYLYIDGELKATGSAYINQDVKIDYSWDTRLHANGSIHVIEIKGYTYGSGVLSVAKGTVTIDETVDITGPLVSITSPANESTVAPSGEVIQIVADAWDDFGVTKVEFYVDSMLVGTVTDAPFTFNWTTKVGQHNVYAKAYDAAGHVTTSSKVKVYVPAKGTLISPTDGSLVGGIVTPITASFNDYMTGETFLYIDGELKAQGWVMSSKTVSFDYYWDTNQYTNGTNHIIEIKAPTNIGFVLSTAKGTVTIDHSVDITNPKITVTSPTNESTIAPSGDIVTITTDTWDDFGVTKVEFYVDSMLVGTVTDAPFTFNWTTKVGQHNVYAKAYDAAGHVTTSSKVKVYVPAKGTLISPTDGAEVNGNLTTFTATFSDPMYGETFLYIDGVLVAQGWVSNNKNISINYTWDTTQYINGTSHIIEIRANTYMGFIPSVAKGTLVINNN